MLPFDIVFPNALFSLHRQGFPIVVFRDPSVFNLLLIGKVAVIFLIQGYKVFNIKDD